MTVNTDKRSVDFSKLKLLREKTGVSFSLCKKALEETANDMAASQKLLTKWGADKLADKSGRSTSQGAIFSYVHHNKKLLLSLRFSVRLILWQITSNFKN